MAGNARRGFALMDPDRQREIARKGGKAAHEKGTAHQFSSEGAREAGRRPSRALRRLRGQPRRGGSSSRAQRGQRHDAGVRRSGHGLAPEPGPGRMRGDPQPATRAKRAAARRPPAEPRPLKRQEAEPHICPTCFMQLPASGRCDTCA